MHTLETIPHEVLEHVAYFAGTQQIVGPPTDILSLLLTSHTIHTALSPATNPHLYARIFEAKFDVDALRERMDGTLPSANEVSVELQARCLALQRIRNDTFTSATPTRAYPEERFLHDLWTLYLMLLEDEGRNMRHMREWARLHEWLRKYWSKVIRSDDNDSLRTTPSWGKDWAGDTEQNALAMWLFWFLLDPSQNTDDSVMSAVLKVIALGASKYRISIPSWTRFDSSSPPSHPFRVSPPQLRGFTYIRPTLRLCVPPLVAPAILSYFALLNSQPEAHVVPNLLGMDQLLRPALPTLAKEERDAEWLRIKALGRTLLYPQDSRVPSVKMALKPGSIAGMWEGMFIYTEFHMFTATMVADVPPSFLERSGIAQHRQTWRLQEHHLLRPRNAPNTLTVERAAFASGPDMETDAHSALSGYFVAQTRLVKSTSRLTLEVTTPGKTALTYNTWTEAGYVGLDGETEEYEVEDVIVTGEGHSAWGQFQLLGRVRPCDGFMNLRKTYLNSDRGQWLYRGFLVGGEQGNISGRWRDTMSEDELGGYEGCFFLGRRR